MQFNWVGFTTVTLAGVFLSSVGHSVTPCLRKSGFFKASGQMIYIKLLIRFFVTFRRFAMHSLRKSFAFVPWNLVLLLCLGALTESSILGGLDSKYLDQLNSFLVPVLQSSSRSSFVRCWHAKTDGWAASTFHSNCDGKGPTVTIIQVDKYIFGGYTDASWSGPSPGKYEIMVAQFSFSL